ncbi:ATP-grasp domain-containing protein [Planotetraspora thailandica]|uniref:ATP-grasp domain-containing protein n=1 Tax=Planotetraspora thailandica TaxID=487172 RepID=UPI001EF21256|nr:ATP-grasp domain-containing protein [Planotetraspora thailandica]
MAGADDEGWLVAAAAALRDGPVCGVVAFSEQHVRAAALLADELGLPGPGLRAVLTSRNKLVQRELFGRRNLAQPEYHLARSAEDAAAWAEGRYPVVAKPLSSSGSMGVQIVTDENELHTWCQENDSPKSFLVEGYLSGPEYSVEAVASAGEIVFWSVTEKITTEAPHFVELEHHVPAQVGGEEKSAIRSVLGEVAGALGMRSGIMHLELRLEPAGPHIMEVAVRTPGDYIMDVVQAATGVDLYDAVIAVACDDTPSVTATDDHIASVWFPAPEPGTVTSVSGVDRVQALEGVVNIEIDVAAGSVIHPLRSSMDRIGMVIYRAADRVALESLRKRIHDELVISVQPSSS